MVSRQATGQQLADPSLIGSIGKRPFDEPLYIYKAPLNGYSLGWKIRDYFTAFDMRMRKFLNQIDHLGTQRIRNTLYLLLGDWGRRIFSVTFIVIVARALGPSSFGEYGLAQDLALLLSPLVELGLAAFLIREVARTPDQVSTYVNGALSLRMVMSVFVLPLSIMLALFLGYSQSVIILVGLQMGWIILDTFGRGFRRAIMAFDRMKYEGVLNTSHGAIRLALAIAALALGAGAIGVSIADLLTAFIIFIISLYVFYHVVDAAPRLSFEWRPWRSWLPTLLPLALMQLVLASWMRINSQILYQYDSGSAVGILTAVNRLIFMVIPLATYQVVANTPNLARLSKINRVAFIHSASKQLKWIVYIAGMISLLLCLASPLVIRLIYGPAYQDAVPLLQVLAWQSLLYGICFSLVYTLIVDDQQVIALILSAVSLAVFVGISLLLVPRYSYMGSGWSTIIGYTVWASSLLGFATKKGLLNWTLIKPSINDWRQLKRVVNRS